MAMLMEEKYGMEMRGLTGGLYRISEWIMRLSVINVLWIVCSIPFFFVVLSLIFQPNVENVVEIIKQSLFLLAVLAPFTLIPATAAVFTVARKWVTGDPDVPLLRTFFGGYKDNYLQSMLGGIVLEIIGFLLYNAYFFYSGQSGLTKLLSFVFLLLLFLLVSVFLNYISIMVHFHMKFWQVLKNAVLMTIGNPFLSISTIVINFVIIYICFKFTFLFPFFMGSVIAIVTFFQFHRNYERLMNKIRILEEANAEKEALLNKADDPTSETVNR
jgi:uncharacterized membrane protein YesL